jgi:amino acid transporter
MIGAYLMTAVAISLAFVVFLRHFLEAVGLPGPMPNEALAIVLLVLAADTAAWRDISFSSRFGLILETGSIAILVVITTIIVVRRGTLFGSLQLDFSHLAYGGIATSLTFAVFCFVGFDGDARAIAESTSPITEMTRRAGLSAAAGVLYFGAIISSAACLLASLNAASRLVFSMARYAFIEASLAAVHPRHRTPHVAVLLSAVAGKGAPPARQARPVVDQAGPDLV